MTTDLYLDFLGRLGMSGIYQTPIGLPEYLKSILESQMFARPLS